MESVYARIDMYVSISESPFGVFWIIWKFRVWKYTSIMLVSSLVKVHQPILKFLLKFLSLLFFYRMLIVNISMACFLLRSLIFLSTRHWRFNTLFCAQMLKIPNDFAIIRLFYTWTFFYLRLEPVIGWRLGFDKRPFFYLPLFSLFERWV